MRPQHLIPVHPLTEPVNTVTGVERVKRNPPRLRGSTAGQNTQSATLVRHGTLQRQSSGSVLTQFATGSLFNIAGGYLAI